MLGRGISDPLFGVMQEQNPFHTTIDTRVVEEPTSHESFNIGSLMTSGNGKLNKIAFALKYAMTNEEINPLVIYLPTKIQFTRSKDGRGFLQYGEEKFEAEGNNFPMDRTGWILGEWDPMTTHWTLGINSVPVWGKYQWKGIVGVETDSVSFPNFMNGASIRNLIYGPSEEVWREVHFAPNNNSNVMNRFSNSYQGKDIQHQAYQNFYHPQIDYSDLWY